MSRFTKEFEKEWKSKIVIHDQEEVTVYKSSYEEDTQELLLRQSRDNMVQTAILLGNINSVLKQMNK